VGTNVCGVASFVHFSGVQRTPYRFDVGDRRMMHRIFKSTFDKGAG
jgi:hypothetical protein